MASGFTSEKHRIKRSKKLSIAQATELTEKMALVFAQIKDPRVARTRVHVLTDILIIGILSVIAGGNGWEDMENYGVSKGEWLEQFLALPGGIPSADTFRRVFERINPKVFEQGCISLLRMCQKRVKMKKLVKSSNKDEVNKMTPSDQQQLKAHLKAAAKIVYRNTAPTELKSFESIEKSVRQKMLSEVGPEIGSFFFQQYQEFKQENPEK